MTDSVPTIRGKANKNTQWHGRWAEYHTMRQLEIKKQHARRPINVRLTEAQLAIKAFLRLCKVRLYGSNSPENNPD